MEGIIGVVGTAKQKVSYLVCVGALFFIDKSSALRFIDEPVLCLGVIFESVAVILGRRINGRPLIEAAIYQEFF